MEKLSYKLPVFEGPLDLLLHLITKNKLNIYDIPIAVASGPVYGADPGHVRKEDLEYRQRISGNGRKAGSSEKRFSAAKA